MTRPTSRHPTELELGILKILWENGPLSGNEIRNALSVHRDLTYQSVMTILGIMEEKKYVSRKKSRGSYAYRAKVSRESTCKRMMRDLVNALYEGSVGSAMINLLQNADINDEELDQVIQLANQMKKG